MLKLFHNPLKELLNVWLIFKKIKKEVATNTNGELNIELFVGGVQGDEKEVVEKMRTGQLQMAAITAVGLAKIVPDALIFQLPGLFENPAQLDMVRNKVGPDIEKQMEAERQKRAQITLAVADKEARINVSEGERQEAINLSEGDRQRRINEAKGRSEEIALLATASAAAITAMATAIRKPGGALAVKMEILEQFIDEFGKILETADVSVVPAQLATLQGFFQGIGEVSKTLPTPPNVTTT